MMVEALALAPTSADMLAVLQAIADALVAVNVLWLRSQIRRGATPPRTLLAAAPPYAPQGVRYVEHHGAPVDTTRVYQDGPTAMHSGRATCIDIACYDAAASLVLAGVPMRVSIEGSRARAGAALRCHAWLVGPNGERIDSLASMGG